MPIISDQTGELEEPGADRFFLQLQLLAVGLVLKEPLELIAELRRVQSLVLEGVLDINRVFARIDSYLVKVHECLSEDRWILQELQSIESDLRMIHIAIFIE